MLAHANAHNILLFFFSVPVFLNGKYWGICSRPQGLRLAEPTGTGRVPQDNSRAGTDTPAQGEGVSNLSADSFQDHAPSFGNASAEKRPHGPRVEVLPTIPGPGQLNTCPGQQGWRNRNTPGGGWNFPIFPTPLKSEFSEFWDTVKRGISSGDCATIGDTFSEREKLNFLQQ